MYENFFGLREKPFTLRPDPEFLYMGRKHSIAYAMLEYGLLNEAGIILITGEIGSGKTTLIRHLLNQLDASSLVGLISNTHHAFGNLIQWVSDAFSLPIEGKDKVSLYRQFVDFLIREYARGKRVILIIDEAQNMDSETLEELRVISNINADKNLVLQLVLVGQPELRAKLQAPEMEQFAQRIGSDYHLSALDVNETGAYIKHRLKIAGSAVNLFSTDAIDAIFVYSGGVPRLINSLCDQSLVFGFANHSAEISKDIVEELVREKRQLGLFGAKRDSGNTEDLKVEAVTNAGQHI